MRCGVRVSASSNAARSRRARKQAIRSRGCSVLRPDRAVINRMGFNNRGMEAMAAAARTAAQRDGIVGINIGANKDSADRIADYRSPSLGSRPSRIT